MRPPIDSAEWIDAAEVAELLHVSPYTLAGWRSERKGPGYLKFGKVVRYRRDDVHAFIESHYVQHPKARNKGEVTQ